MAISINEQYPGKTAGVSTAYPYGKARNVTVPSDGTGTPWEAAIVNDDQGFKQALLQAASIIPSGVPDSATASQYLDALRVLIESVAFGVNQSNVVYNSAARNYNTQYTNTTGKTILVTICSPDTVSLTPILSVLVDGVEIIQHLYDTGSGVGSSVVTFAVPPGKTYRANLTGASITPTKWTEFR